MATGLLTSLMCRKISQKALLASVKSSPVCPLRIAPVSATYILSRHRSDLTPEQLKKLAAEPGELVYKGRIGHLFRILKIFSLSTSTVGLAIQPYLLITYSGMSTMAAVPMFGAINLFVFMNPLLIHFVAKKYVSELYFDQNTGMFTAILLTFFARRMQFKFKAEDVEVPDVPGPFSMLNAKGKPLFMHEADFRDMAVYKHMMGFDQPLELLHKEIENENYKEK